MKSSLTLLTILLLTSFTVKADIKSVLENGFTADVVSKTTGRTSVESKGKMYLMKNKMRMDTVTTASGRSIEGSMIMNTEKQTALMVMPQQSMFMEMPIDKNEVAKIGLTAENWSDKKPVGKVAIDGVMTDKYEHTDKTCKITSYFATETSFPVKTEADCNGTHTIAEYKNVKAGAVPDKTFEVPVGYRKFDASQFMR